MARPLRGRLSNLPSNATYQTKNALDSTYPEIKQPILQTEDRSLLLSVAKSHKVSYVVLDDGSIINIELLHNPTERTANSIYNYLDSLYYTPKLPRLLPHHPHPLKAHSPIKNSMSQNRWRHLRLMR